jgi:hypothetical protein
MPFSIKYLFTNSYIKDNSFRFSNPLNFFSWVLLLTDPTDVKLRLLKINNDMVYFLLHPLIYIILEWYFQTIFILTTFYRHYTWPYSLYCSSINALICNNPSQYYKSIEFIALLYKKILTNKTRKEKN